MIRIYSECFSAVMGLVMVLIPEAVFKNIFLGYFNTCSKNNIANLIISNCLFASKLIFNYLFSYVKLKLTNITIYKERIEMIH